MVLSMYTAQNLRKGCGISGMIFWYYTPEFFHTNGNGLCSQRLNGVTKGVYILYSLSMDACQYPFCISASVTDCHQCSVWVGKKTSLFVDEAIVGTQSVGSICFQGDGDRRYKGQWGRP